MNAFRGSGIRAFGKPASARKASDVTGHADQGRFVDDAYGQILQILLTIPAYALTEFGGALRSVLCSLPEDARLEILTAHGFAAQARSLTTARRYKTRIHEAPPGLNFSHWARDAIFAVENDSANSLSLSHSFARHDDAEAARQLARHSRMPLIETKLPIEGGNLLAAGNDLLFSVDLVGPHSDVIFDKSRRNVAVSSSHPREPEALVASAVLTSGWRERQRAGVGHGQRQPLFHIDLFIAPAGAADDGRSRWLVGCPRLGAEVLGLPLLDHADAVLFDVVATELIEKGFDVIRNPLPLIWLDDPATRTRTWLHLPVNNVLVEITRHGGSKVWLPLFEDTAWPELRCVDEANREIWKSLGFDVNCIAGCLPLAERRGALRCMCNIVERAPF